MDDEGKAILRELVEREEAAICMETCKICGERIPRGEECALDVSTKWHPDRFWTVCLDCLHAEETARSATIAHVIADGEDSIMDDLPF